jgi:hypothetical protein
MELTAVIHGPVLTFCVPRQSCIPGLHERFTNRDRLPRSHVLASHDSPSFSSGVPRCRLGGIRHPTPATPLDTARGRLIGHEVSHLTPPLLDLKATLLRQQSGGLPDSRSLSIPPLFISSLGRTLSSHASASVLEHRLTCLTFYWAVFDF